MFCYQLALILRMSHDDFGEWMLNGAVLNLFLGEEENSKAESIIGLAEACKYAWLDFGSALMLSLFM